MYYVTFSDFPLLAAYILSTPPCLWHENSFLLWLNDISLYCIHISKLERQFGCFLFLFNYKERQFQHSCTSLYAKINFQMVKYLKALSVDWMTRLFYVCKTTLKYLLTIVLLHQKRMTVTAIPHLCQHLLLPVFFFPLPIFILTYLCYKYT